MPHPPEQAQTNKRDECRPDRGPEHLRQPHLVKRREIVKAHQNRDISVLELLVGVNLGNGTRIRVIPEKKTDGGEHERGRSKPERRSQAVQKAAEGVGVLLPSENDYEGEPLERIASCSSMPSPSASS